MAATLPPNLSGPISIPPPPSTAEESYDAYLDGVLAQLNRLYRDNVRNLEDKFEYDIFRPSWFSDSVVQKKPFVTFLGPFSAGKSTFINYLMQANCLLTGPQPVTDKFTVIMHGDDMQPIPGRVLVADSSQPFRGLNQFGDAFVECFAGLLAPHPILRSVSIVDTPGVLEAAGDIHSRRYDYVKVCRWFVERSDLVFFLFDPTKLDAGMELRMLFKHAVKGFENRVRIVLNKADMVGPQELMRVYGSLFWNLSNLINTTEPPRVYVSSFWDQPYKPGTNHQLFTDEKCDLLYDLTEVVPLQSLDKRVTNVLRRAQDVLIHVLIVATLSQNMPSFFGKDKAKKEALGRLAETYQDIAAKYKLSVNDFPPPEDYARFFDKVDLFAMPNIEKLNKKGWIVALKKLIEVDLPMLLKPIKTTGMVDPRDRKHAIMVQRQYNQQLEAQLQGQRGNQGALGDMAAPAFRAQTLNVAVASPTLQQQQVMMGYASQPPPQPVMGAVIGTNLSMAGMPPEMQLLLLQAQMQQQQQRAVAPPPPPPPAQVVDPQQQMLMLQLQLLQMQQQQAALKQPA